MTDIPHINTAADLSRRLRTERGAGWQVVDTYLGRYLGEEGPVRPGYTVYAPFGLERSVEATEDAVMAAVNQMSKSIWASTSGSTGSVGQRWDDERE